MSKEKKIEPASPVRIEPKPNALVPQRRRVSFHDTTPSLTEQSHKESCDINNIVKHYGADELQRTMQARPQLFTGDYTPPQDLMEAISIVNHAEEQFAALPATVRARFENNPQRFLEFAQASGNEKEMLSLGLLKKRPQNDPPASRKDIQELADRISPKGKRPPAGGPKGEEDA